MPIVQNHSMSHDMRTMLADKRVFFSYFDVFETDYGIHDREVIRVFSQFASLLEYFSLGVAVWSIWFSTLVAAFARLDPDSWWPDPFFAGRSGRCLR